MTTMTLDEAVAKIELRWPAHPDLGDNARSATGEEYVVITSGGVCKEGASFKFFPTEAEAIDRWLASVLAYGEGKTGTLYYRVEPELAGDQEGYTVYSRLLISDRPQVQEQRLSK